MNAALNNGFLCDSNKSASSFENLIVATNGITQTILQRRGSLLPPVHGSSASRPRKRTGYLRFRAKSLSLKSMKNIAGTEHSMGGGGGIWGGIVKTIPMQKRVRAVRSAASELGGALGKLRSISFRSMGIDGVKCTRPELRVRLASDGDNKGMRNVNQAAFGEHDENSNTQPANFSMPDEASNVRNPFNTPPQSPSTNLERSRSFDSIPMPLSELTNDPKFWWKKEKHTREKIGQLLGDEAGVAEYEQMVAQVTGVGMAEENA